MIHFESPIYLYLLCLIPVFCVIMYLTEILRKKKLKRFGDAELLKQLTPDASNIRRWIKFGLLQLALAMLIIIVARPQMGTKVSNEKRNGIECIIALDISNSMLAEDVQPSRLDKSKMLIEGLLDKFSNDKIGLVVFAGEAYVQLPITADYVSAKMFLQNIDPSLIQTQGTDIARAINLSMNSFTQQDKIGKAIIVITDGEDHEGGAMEAAKAANAKGMNVFILGIGNPEGAPIPDGKGGYMTDNTGNTVMTSLNEQMCKEVAAAGKGTYIHVDNTSSAQDRLNDELAKLQQGEMKSTIYSEYSEQFQAFGIFFILLLILEICINETVNPFFRRIHIFKRRTLMITLLFALGTVGAFSQNDRTYIRQGNRQFRMGNADKAEVEYRKAIVKKNNNPQANYNLGCALMQQQKDSLAMVQFDKASRMETSKFRRSMSYHNMGVIAQRHQQYGPAIKCYQEALRLNPNDNETRYNMILCKKLMKNQNQPQQNQNQNKNDKDKNKQDQDKQKQDQQKQENNPQKQEQISKDNAERMLDAADQQEKATRKKMEKAMSQPQRRNLQKNW